MGVEHLNRCRGAAGEPVAVWGDVEWLDTTQYRNLRSEEGARAWMAGGFSPAANAAAYE